MSLSDRALRSAGWTTVAGYIQLAVSFIGNIILARILVPDDFGSFALALSLLSFLFMLAGFGSQDAIIQCRDDTVSDLISTAFWITLGISLSLGILGTLFGVIIRPFYEPVVTQALIAMTWVGSLNNMAGVFGAILQRDLRFKAVATGTILSSILSFAAAAGAAWFGAGPWALVLREFISSLLRLFGYWLFSQYRLIFRFNIQAARWIWSFGWRMMVSRTTEVIFGRLDNFVVGTVMGTVALGHYALAYRLAFLGQQLTQGSIQQVVLSTFSIVQHSNQKLEYGFERLSYWLLRIVFPLGLVIALAGENLVTWVYGEKWQLAGRVFQVMSVFLVILPLHGSLKQFLIGAGHIDVVIRTRFVQLAFFVPAVVVAALVGDLVTVTWAVNLSMLLSWWLMMRFAGTIIAVDWDYLFKLPLVSMAISGGLCITATTLVLDGIGRLPLLVAQSAIIGIGYVCTLFLLERRTLIAEATLIRTRLQP